MDLHTVLKQAMQKHLPPILPNAFGGATCLKINGDRVNPVYLLVSVGAAVTH
jgi:hypothetical protein